MRKVKLFTLLTALICAVSMQAQSNLVAVPNPSSSYSPTTIVNGDFSSEPWMDYVYNSTTYTKNSSGKPTQGKVVAPIPNGVGGGWNTSDNTIAYGVTTLFEWTNVLSTYNTTMSSSANSGHGYFIEMNAEHAAVFSQDLATYGNDVIRWTLQHAVRTTNGAPSPQAMEVEIGAPNRDGKDNIIATSGTGGEVNAQIQESTKAVYLASGCSGYNGYGGVSGNLEYLSLITSQATQWYTVTGVYTVPDGQSVTRFAFISRNASSPGVGNLLDNLTFSTLIGNLSAVENSNGSVSLRGYWGETDTSKKLMVKIGDETTAIDMTSMVEKNFIITIPKSAIGNAAQLEVYHQDYEAAKRTISVSAYAYDVTANLANGAYWATFYSNAGNYQAPDGTKVFAVNLNTTTAEITMTEISDGIVKSGEGVVLKQETTSSESTTTITMTPTETAATDSYFSGNSLTGTMTNIPNPGNAYVLNYTATNGVGFYKLKSGKTIDANKAYLTYGGTSAPEFLGFGNETTGIEMPTVEDNADAVVYDLQGRRVQNPTKGPYIVNGKKVVIK